MTAPTKTAKTLLTSQSLAAGASISITEWDLSGKWGGILFIKITNGSSAPTTAPTVKFYAGENSGVKRQTYVVSGDTVNSSISEPWFEYSIGFMFANATITNGATNAITVEAYGQEVTSVA
ncbi:MAG: hypothetical protein V4493_01200 [Pseudomonadota bacterium]